MPALSGEQAAFSASAPPPEIQELRSLFTTRRMRKKQIAQVKNQIRSLPKESLRGFTQEEIFGRKSRERIRGLDAGSTMSFQVGYLLDDLEHLESRVDPLKDEIMARAASHMREIDILTSMKGISVFIAIAVIADIISVERFRH